MSVVLPSAVPRKFCAVCGVDVAARKRVKDVEGRYYCTTCWEEDQQRREDDLIPLAEENRPRVVHRPPADPHASRPSGRDQVGPPQAVGLDRDRQVEDHLHQIAKWERRMLWVLAASLMLVLIPPLILLLIPVHVFVVFKLARSLDKNGVLWAIGTLVPYAGLIVLIVLNVQATGVLKSAGLHAPMFRKWRRVTR